MRSPARVLVLALLASVSLGGTARAEPSQESAEHQSTISAIAAAATDSFFDTAARGREEREFIDRWIRLVTSAHPEGLLVRVKAFDPSTGRFTLHETLPAGAVQPNDRYSLASLDSVPLSSFTPSSFAAAFESIAALSLPTTLTADRFTQIIESSTGGNGANGADTTLADAVNGSRGGDGGAITMMVDFGPFNITTVNQSALLARSRGGSGGNGGDNTAIAEAVGGNGGRGGNGGTVDVTTLSAGGGIFTSDAPAILASSRGGDGGNGGDGGAIGGAFGGNGGLGGNGGAVTVKAANPISTTGDDAHGIVGQSLGGSGGDGGNGKGIVSGGGSGSGSGNGGRVEITSSGSIDTTGSDAYGVFAQSLGGFAGAGGASGGLVTWGGGASSGGDGGETIIHNSGTITAFGGRAHALFAQSIGGNGGAAGDAGGVVALGGASGSGGDGGRVEITNSGDLFAGLFHSRGIYAQSVGGGGGDAGASNGLFSIGGSGNTTGNGGEVYVDNSGSIAAASYAIFAQSVGGGGGDGGFAGGWFSIGGTGGSGGNATKVTVDNTGSLATIHDRSSAISAVSLGGGGGSGGGSVALGAFVSRAIGGSGAIGGDGDEVTVTSSAPNIVTLGERAHGVFAQSAGGGGGDGGFAASASVGYIVSVGIGRGGAGTGGGDGDIVRATIGGNIATAGREAAGVFAQSIGGGGGDGGWSITGAASDTAAVTFNFGGTAGGGGSSSSVFVTSTGGTVTTAGERAYGLFAQSIGGGGGNGGFSITAAGSGVVSGSLGLGGGGGGGGGAGIVNIVNAHTVFTAGREAHAVFAHSVGGGGGNGGFSIAASGAGTGAASFSLGGSAGGGGGGGTVDVQSTGGLVTLGDRAIGLFAQSVGGGGGNGGFSISGSGAGTAAGTFNIGGSGGSGGSGALVIVHNTGLIETGGHDAHGLFAQSVGGGGGNGAFSLTGSGAGTASASIGVGGSGGSGNIGGRVDVTSRGSIETWGQGSVGLLAQSLGGGGGVGRFSISGSGAGTGAATFSLGGNGGSGADGGSVWVVNQGAITTHADDAIGLYAQSVGGGGGRAGFSITGSAAGTGAGSLGIGGSGLGGGDGSTVDVHSSGSIMTGGDGAIGLFAQSVGGGGGQGRFSISGSAAKTGAIAASFGGDGGAEINDIGGGGGNGATVRIDNNATISTLGLDAYGILGQSVGGGGGNGGVSFSAGVSSTGGALNGGLGGFGGVAGSAAQVTLTNRAAVTTGGDGSHAIAAQSVGGGGGNGGFSGALGASSGPKPNVAVAVGGFGGAAGNGSIIQLLNHAALTTGGESASGIFAQSIGGGGGNGGGTLAVALGSHQGAMNASLAVGGQGSTGGDGALVDLDNFGNIFAAKTGSSGIFAQSIGGGGGDGGFKITGTASKGTLTNDLALNIGGHAGAGGIGGEVDVNNTGNIVVLGSTGDGIRAQSIGGGGGHGGFSFSGTIAGASANEASIAVGGAGGNGNTAANVKVANTGNIETGSQATVDYVRAVAADLGPRMTAEIEQALFDLAYTAQSAHGIVAESIGGGGGNGGQAIAVGLGAGGDTWNLNAAASFGGSGGMGNSSSRVDVINHGTVTTWLDDSHGIFAKSIGGGGGEGGAAFTAVVAAGAANQGRSFNANLSMAGDGGAGNLGGIVDVLSTAPIFTHGDQSNAILAQSIGGGGGVGGTARGVNLLLKAGSAKLPDGKAPGVNWKANVTVGGHGGDGNHAATVKVDNHAALSTIGAYSRGIFAQSVGGGGGSGGDGIKGTGTAADKVLMIGGNLVDYLLKPEENKNAKGASKLNFLRDWSFTVGGDAGNSGNGQKTEVLNSGDITTIGLGSTAIFAQSIGGGGGEAFGYAAAEFEGGRSEAGATGRVGFGGDGGSAGHGGEVHVTSSGTLTTFGEEALGIFAQSVGGGGGKAGSIKRTLDEEKTIPVVGVTVPALNIGLGVEWGGNGGQAGNGGKVTVESTGHISTLGAAAYGIFAQSVGGGGGALGGLGLLSELLSEHVNFAGSVGGMGSGGEVKVTQVGTINTSGTGADGIFAQSVGGQTDGVEHGGMGGTVTVELTGNVFATGADSNGILAQSLGLAGNSSINITIHDGIVIGGSGVGVGIDIVDGASNTLTSHGTIATVDGVLGLAVRGSSGDDTVTSTRTLIGSVDLGSGVNALTITSSGRFDSGAIINLGDGNVFTNAGLLSPGGAGRAETTTLTGNLLETGTPTWLVDLGEIGISDSLSVQGSATAGASTTALHINMLTTPASSGGVYTLLSARDGGLEGADFRFGTLLGAMPIGQTFDLVNSNTSERLTLFPSTGTFYWNGGASRLWSSGFVDGESNWTRTGGDDFIYGTPGAATNVIFLPGGDVTALGANFTINSLTFAGGPSASSGPSAILPGHALTLASPNGITVDSGAPGAAIGVDLVLGAHQHWNNGASLAISGSTITGLDRSLTVAGSGSTFIDAAIQTGGGSLTKEGSGTLFLSGANAYGGGTFVRGGALVGNTTSLQGAIVNDAIVAFDQASAGTYSGLMSGNGALFKMNRGLLVLSGANTYHGGTWVAGGTLQGDTRSLQGDFLTDATVVFDQSAAGVFEGSLFGAGVLRKQGGGSLTLSGNSGAFTGSTIVAAGQLFVNGWLGGGSVQVQSGTLLGGTGILPTATIARGGTLAPGNSIGTLGTIGNIVFEAGSSYRVEAAADATSDRTLATGTITAQAGTVEVMTEGTAYKPITRYMILAGNSVSGTFANATTNQSFLDPSLQYSASQVQLTLRRNDVDFHSGAGGSTGAAGGALNQLVATATGPMESVINNLYGLPDGDALARVRSMAGGHYQHVTSGSLVDSRLFTETSLSRLGRRAADDEGGAGSDAALAATGAMTAWVGEEQQSGWWVRGLGGSSSLSGASGDSGASVPTHGLVAGFDRAITQNLTLGASGARMDPEVDQQDAGDRTTFRAIYAGVHGSYRRGAAQFAGAFGAGFGEYHTRRDVLLGDTAPSIAAADYDGDTYTVNLRYGHAITLGGRFTAEAEVGFQAGTQRFEASTETGAGAVSLVLPQRTISTERSLLGGRVTRPLGSAGRDTLFVEARGAWAHEFDPRGGMQARFAGDTVTDGFVIPPIGQLRNSAVLGGSVYTGTWERFRLFADVTSELGDDLQGVSGSIGFGIRW